MGATLSAMATQAAVPLAVSSVQIVLVALGAAIPAAPAVQTHAEVVTVALRVVVETGVLEIVSQPAVPAALQAAELSAAAVTEPAQKSITLIRGGKHGYLHGF